MRWFSAIIISLAVMLTVAFSGCGASQLNLFSPEQDIELGKQVAQEIESNPSEYPILSESRNPEAYRYVRNIVNRILSTGQVEYRNEFAWSVKIIDNDEVLNAFATPGGYIYLYTGLIKFLDSEDELAGVLGHEMAHSARRHATKQATQAYGLSALLSIVTGNANPGVLAQIAAGLLQLRFGRADETEADVYSVIYLCETDYNSAGAAGFFEKMQNQPSPPEFLSTHPNPGNRVQNIQQQAKERGCRGSATNRSQYTKFKQSL